MTRYPLLALLAALFLPALADPTWRAITVDGQQRHALVYPGAAAATTPSPLVLVFHGFTSNASEMAGYSRFHEAWPEATVVYPEGLRVRMPSLDLAGSGWVTDLRADRNRDVRFVDALLPDLAAAYRVDQTRVYCAGFSNGGMFSLLMLALRPNRFAAFCSVAAATSVVWKAEVPKPVLFVHGKNDQVVPFQLGVRVRDLVRRLNRCGGVVSEWRPGYVTYSPNGSGMPVVWHEHDGGHIWPTDLNDNLRRFLAEHTLSAAL